MADVQFPHFCWYAVLDAFVHIRNLKLADRQASRVLYGLKLENDWILIGWISVEYTMLSMLNQWNGIFPLNSKTD